MSTITDAKCFYKITSMRGNFAAWMYQYCTWQHLWQNFKFQTVSMPFSIFKQWWFNRIFNGCKYLSYTVHRLSSFYSPMNHPPKSFGTHQSSPTSIDHNVFVTISQLAEGKSGKQRLKPSTSMMSPCVPICLILAPSLFKLPLTIHT